MFSDLIYRLRALLRRSRMEADLDEEIRLHIERQVDTYVQKGLSREEALRRARIAFGGEEQVKEACRAARGVTLVETLIQDLRYALRLLRRNPGYSIVAIATLGLGIGSCTIMYSVIDAVLLHPVPFDNPRELVSVWTTSPRLRSDPVRDNNWDQIQLSLPEFTAWRDGSTCFCSVAAYATTERTITGSGEAAQLRIGVGTSTLLTVLGIEPAQGRWFEPAEEIPGSGNVVVLSDLFWRIHFGADPGIIGTSITLDNLSYTVIGILPDGFTLPKILGPDRLTSGHRECWIPTGSPRIDHSIWSRSFEGISRLPQGVSFDQAFAETESLIRGNDDPSEIGIMMLPRAAAETRGLHGPLWLLLVATGLLLLIACANITTLLANEVAGRSQEMATRLALGSDSKRIRRQLLTESLMLGILGIGVGILFTWAGIDLVVYLAPPMPGIAGVGVNLRVLLFTGLVGIGTSLLYGLMPAMTVTRSGLVHFLRSRHPSGSIAGRRLQQGTIIVQVALTAWLLVVGGLFARSLLRLNAVDPGFDDNNLLTVHLTLNRDTWPTPTRQNIAYSLVLERIAAIPMVRSVSGAFRLSFLDRPSGNSISIPGYHSESRIRPMARQNSVLPGFLETMGARLLYGRSFDSTDIADTQPVMIVNKTMAGMFWPGDKAVGARVEWEDREWTVVGVVEDMRHLGLDAAIDPSFFVPFAQSPRREMSLVIRTVSDPLDTVSLVREAVRSVDSDIPLSGVSTMAALIAESTRDERYRTLLVLFFSLASALLAGVGILGISARLVTMRFHEWGVRTTLGARPVELGLMVLAGTLRVGLLGLFLGLITAAWSGRLLAGFLYGIEPLDSFTFLVVSLFLTCLILAGSILPARRAATTDPIVALRKE